MNSDVFAYYLWPTVWIGDPPPDDGINIDVSAAADEVYRTTLSTGIAVKVLREGVFAFDFSGYPPTAGLTRGPAPNFDNAAAIILKRVQVMNVHLVCLYTAMVRRPEPLSGIMALSPSEIAAMSSLDGQDISWGNTPARSLWFTRYPSTYSQQVPAVADFRIIGRRPISMESVRDSFDILDPILKHPSSYLLTLLDLYLRSCTAYSEHNYSLSLIMSWSLSERLLQELWKRYLDANRQRQVEGQLHHFITKKRMEKLRDGKDFTASVVTEILSLLDILPASLYEEISAVRRVRNAWIHGLTPVSRQHAEHGVHLAEALLRQVDEVDASVPLLAALHY